MITQPPKWSVALIGSLTLGVAGLSCGAPVSTSEYVTITAPDFTQFAGDSTQPGVHTFLERRCGTLDCHGQTGRPFRLFSTGGLRLINDGGQVSGLGPDSSEEIYANYEALVGLQPEETTKVVDGQDPPTKLLVLAKPLALMTHKGGQELAPGDSGDVCLESWLAGRFNASACSDAAMVP